MRTATVKDIAAVTQMCFIIQEPGEHSASKKLTVRQRFGWCNTAYHNEWSLPSAVRCALLDTAAALENIERKTIRSTVKRFWWFGLGRRESTELVNSGETDQSRKIRALAARVKSMTEDEVRANRKEIEEFIRFDLFPDEAEFKVNVPLITWNPDRHYFVIKEVDDGIQIVPVRVSVSSVKTNTVDRIVTIRYFLWEFIDSEKQYYDLEFHPLGFQQNRSYQYRGKIETETRMFYADRNDAEFEAIRVLRRKKAAIQEQMDSLSVLA